MIFKNLIFTAFIMFSISFQAAFAEDRTSQIQQLITNEDYQTAQGLLSEWADEGDAVAMTNLGAMFFNAWGVERDYTRSAYWFEKALEADPNSNHALYSLGVQYLNGWGVEKDFDRAAQFLLEAAELGNAFAQFELGQAYEQGRVLRYDEDRTIEWYTRAAEQGHISAASRLGKIYFTRVRYGGWGPQEDIEAGGKWYSLAGQLGGPSELFAAGIYYRNVDQFDVAAKWFALAAAEGHSQAQFYMGIIYRDGMGGMQVDRKMANSLFILAENNGNEGAISYLDSIARARSEEINRAVMIGGLLALGAAIISMTPNLPETGYVQPRHGHIPLDLEYLWTE